MSFYIEGPLNTRRVHLPSHKDPDRSPFRITRQTKQVLDLCELGLNGDHVVEYIQGFTYPLLHTASRAGIVLFDNNALRNQQFDPEEEEATRYMFAVMANLPGFTRVRIFEGKEPYEFSRGGVLKAPSTLEEFEQRIRELEIQLALIATGNYREEKLPFNWQKFRTTVFFDTAAALPLHLPETERESAERERENLNRLLYGIDIAL